MCLVFFFDFCTPSNKWPFLCGISLTVLHVAHVCVFAFFNVKRLNELQIYVCGNFFSEVKGCSQFGMMICKIAIFYSVV